MSESNSTVSYRDIPNFPGYRVGDDGSVWSCWGGRKPPRITDKWRQLAQNRNGLCGHLKVSLGRNNQRAVHRLVLEAFVGKRPDGMEACHWDGNPANNSLSNLRWDTRSGNRKDDIRHGKGIGERHHSARLTNQQVRDIRSEYRPGMGFKSLALKHGVSVTTAFLIVSKRAWRHIA